MRRSCGLLGMGIILATSWLFLVMDTAWPVRWTAAMISEARSFNSLMPTDLFLWLLIAILYSHSGYRPNTEDGSQANRQLKQDQRSFANCTARGWLSQILLVSAANKLRL